MTDHKSSDFSNDLVSDRVRDVLTNARCEDAGVVPMSISEEEIILGAMNPNYNKVQTLVSILRSSFRFNIKVNQITAYEWEKWFDQGKATTSRLTNVAGDLTTTKTHETQDDSLGKLENTFQANHQTDISINYQHSSDEGNSHSETQLIDNIPKANPTFQNDQDDNTPSTTDKHDEDDKALEKLANYSVESESTIDEEDSMDEDISLSSDPVIAGVASILNKCSTLKASDIHTEPLEERLRIRYRVDGVLQEVFSLQKSQANAVISRLKIMSNLDIAEKRLPQDGRIRCLLNGQVSDFRVSTLPGKWGEKVVLRALQSDSHILDLGKLISSKNELQLVRDMGNQPYGIVIVVGPTGSGKSTTLYSILSELNTPGVNISTVEDPVEYTLDGIHQVQVIREKGLDFSKALRSLMRQDPDIILVGETRDKETAQTAMEAALTGHMVFTTLHANDTATAITRLSEMGIPPYLVGASITGVIAQRLVRKVCLKCSHTRKLDAQKDHLAMSYGIKQVRVPNILVGQGGRALNDQLCPNCSGTGYKGRLGIYEVLRINEQLRELIMKSATADVIRENATKQGIRNLLGYGMDLVKRQLTTIEEVERVCLLDEEA